MKTAINRLAIGSLVALSLLAETGCAQRPPVPVTADSIAIAEALSGGRKTIGVVALGPTQMMNDNWSDFDPAVRSWLAQGPTFSTLGKRGVRAPGGARKGLRRAFNGIRRCYDPRCQIAGMAFMPVAALFGAVGAEIAWAVKRPEIVNVRPIVKYRPVMPVEVVNASLLKMLDNGTMVKAISERFEQLARAKTDHLFRAVPFEQARRHAPRVEPVDALLTVRVAEAGLIGGPEDDPGVRVKLHIWTRFNRTMFRRFSYKSDGMRRISEWAADDGRLFRQELDRAVENLASQILDGLFPRKPAAV